MRLTTTSTVPIKVTGSELSLDASGTDIIIGLLVANDNTLDLVMDGTVVGHFVPINATGHALNREMVIVGCPPGRHKFYLQMKSDDGTPVNIDIHRFNAMER